MIFRKKKARDCDPAPLVLGSGLFDEAHYRAQGPQIGELSAVDHYLQRGWREGFDPGPGFSIFYYLAAHSDVDEAGVEPLVHYLRHGAHESRRTRPDDVVARPDDEVPDPVAPTLAEWLALARERRDGGPPQVDVIVPVYRGYSETLRCLHSVLSAPQATAYTLSVIFDQGPDDVLRQALVRLARLGLIDLVKMPENGGFVRTCNAGLARHPDRDVVLLNSDTEVYGDWLDRLRAAAYGQPAVATVTPLSNNAEICSYPLFVTDNRMRLEIADAELDRIAAEVNRGETVDIPTGVGFCMYVCREALDAVGLLSEQHFGRGYGEENDLCRRAASAGWRNLLAADVFVRHYGGRSFGSGKAELVARAVAKVEYLHPGYGELIGRFLARDPVRPLRRAIDEARLERRLAGRPAILFVTHALGGGTEKHVQELAERIEEEGTPVLVCRPLGFDTGDFAIGDPRLPHLPNLPGLSMKDGPANLAALLQRLRVVHVHIHHLIQYGPAAGDFFRRTALLAGTDYDVTLHDYFFVCPRINLIDRTGRYCGEPDISTCERCVRHKDAPVYGRDGIWLWREQTDRLLGAARRVFTPSHDTARRYARYVPDRDFVVRPHFGREIVRGAAPDAPAAAKAKDAVRTIAVIGAIGPHKGSPLVYACAAHAAQHHPRLRFHIVGYTDRDEAFRSLGNVLVSGQYRDEELERRLAESGADAAWFPALWPETFSYTLSAALDAGLTPIAFDFGAIAERIRTAGWGVLMPPSLMLRPEPLTAELATFRVPPPPERISTGATYQDIAADYYGWDDNKVPGLAP